MTEEKVLAVLIDENGKEIIPNFKEDELFINVEKTTGIMTEAKERIMVSIVVYKDKLFNYLNNDYAHIVPLIYIKKEVELT